MNRSIAIALLALLTLARQVAAQEPAQSGAHQHTGHQAPVSTDRAALESSAGEPASTEATPAAHTPSAHASHHHTQEHAAQTHDVPVLPPAQRADVPVTPIPILIDEDRMAAAPPPNDHPVHDNGIHSFVQFNRLEAFDDGEGRGGEWEGQAWIGTDLDKLRIRTEGERSHGRIESADMELLYSRAVAPWWDVVAGVRHDFKPGDARDYAAIGIVGLAPYKFEVDATAYIGQGGQTAARIEVEYELLLTNRLVLQPLVELNAYGRDDARRGIGSGLSTAEAGLRLRYEVTRRFAPYLGAVRAWSLGRTGEFARAAEEPTADTRIVAGVRIWF